MSAKPRSIKIHDFFHNAIYNRKEQEKFLIKISVKSKQIYKK